MMLPMLWTRCSCVARLTRYSNVGPTLTPAHITHNSCSNSCVLLCTAGSSEWFAAALQRDSSSSSWEAANNQALAAMYGGSLSAAIGSLEGAFQASPGPLLRVRRLIERGWVQGVLRGTARRSTCSQGMAA